MTNPTLERAARALADSDGQRFKLGSLYDRNPDLYLRLARAVLMAVMPTLERYDSDYAGSYKDERGDYVLYADLEAILNDGEGE